MTRRRALVSAGTISAGALLSACGADDAATPKTTADVTTTEGTTATVQPQTSTSGDLAAKFDASAACQQTAELTEGPYYLDVDRVRSDIREDREGVELVVGVRVRDAASCEPIGNAVVELWHCDAVGDYSGVQGQSGTFLRGAQVTSADGITEITTIYPGFYVGRCPHIHAKVILDNATALTTQLFFDEQITEAVYQGEPYAQNTGPYTSNAQDGIYVADLELALSKDGDAYLGLITFDVTTPA